VMKPQRLARVFRFLLPVHDMGLDAALVAALWQVLVLRSAAISCPAQVTAALFFAVWGIYLGDRLWDARRNRALLTRRHRFAWRHGVVIGALAGLSGLLAFCFAAAFAIPSFWLPGGAVAGLCAAYYVVRAVFPEWECGRAWVVGFVFAAGTLLPVAFGAGWSSFPGWSLLALGSLFTASVRLCIWAEAKMLGGSSPLSLMVPLLISGLGFASLALEGGHPAALAGAVSIASLGLLARRAEAIEPEVLAALADAVLFIPAAVSLAVF